MSLPTMLVFLIGVCVLTISVRHTWMRARFLNNAARATGTIIDAQQHQQVQFKTADGQTIVFIQNGFLDGQLGETVPVVYSPAEPQANAIVDRFWPLWGLSIWVLPMGICFGITPLFGGEAYRIGSDIKRDRDPDVQR